MDNLFDELTWRGMVFDATEGLSALFAKEPLTAYIGFDPSAPSLHVGSLLTVMGLARLQRFGHAPIAIVGGGTGMIGDPSGKSQERVLLSPERIDENVAGVRVQLEQFLDFEPRAGAPTAARIVNNADWLATIDLISFLREAGKYFTVNYMLQKESVSRRLESEEGISFTEFSYLVLQAYDFLQVFDRFGCALQMGGSDQWGNITAGIDLIRRVRGAAAHGLTMPLVTKGDGAKFGKTETGTIWLDPARTSAYEMYQFWLNTADADVGRFLKSFTFLSPAEIDELVRQTRATPEKREAQRVLARDVTRLVHGESGLRAAEAITEALFSGDVTGLSESQLDQAFQGAPRTELAQDEAAAVPLVDLLVKAGLAESKRAGRELIGAGAVQLNGRRVENPAAIVSRDAALHGRFLILRKGKRSYHVVTVG